MNPAECTHVILHVKKGKGPHVPVAARVLELDAAHPILGRNRQ
jgi:hypothetical protein